MKIFSRICEWFKNKFKEESEIGHYSLSSEPSVKFNHIPDHLSPSLSYSKIQRNNACYEVVSAKDDTVIVYDIQSGRELKFHKETFHALFVEVGRFQSGSLKPLQTH